MSPTRKIEIMTFFVFFCVRSDQRDTVDGDHWWIGKHRSNCSSFPLESEQTDSPMQSFLNEGEMFVRLCTSVNSKCDRMTNKSIIDSSLIFFLSDRWSSSKKNNSFIIGQVRQETRTIIDEVSSVIFTTSDSKGQWSAIALFSVSHPEVTLGCGKIRSRVQLTACFLRRMTTGDRGARENERFVHSIILYLQRW